MSFSVRSDCLRPLPLRMSSISLDEEVRLHSSNQQREKYNLLSNLFGIIVALDYLERAYVRDSITAAEYSPACTRLLSQYKTMLKLVGNDVPSVEDFMARYHVCSKMLSVPETHSS